MPEIIDAREPDVITRTLISERARLGLSKSAAAKAAGVTPVMWARYEKGITPGGQALLRLAKAGFAISALFAPDRMSPEPVSSPSAKPQDRLSDLSPKEEMLVRSFRFLSAQKQGFVDGFISLLVGPASADSGQATQKLRHIRRGRATPEMAVPHRHTEPTLLGALAPNDRLTVERDNT